MVRSDDKGNFANNMMAKLLKSYYTATCYPTCFYTGAVYMFSSFATGTWTNTQLLIPPISSAISGYSFGTTIALSNNVMVVDASGLCTFIFRI